MTITGIVAEFNPFHNGHRYLLSQAEGVKIVAMSGNFVQRGEPAVVDKWTRAEMALKCGADLVVELPFLVAVQSADYFAQGAVDILERLGVDNLAFGTEENLDYQHFSQIYADNQQKMVDYLQNLPDNLSYPQKTQKMWETFAGVNFTGNTPNHILGLSYAKACAGKSIKLSPIMRQGAGYHSLETDVAFASATNLRIHRQDKAFVDKFMPQADLFLGAPQVTWENYFQLLKYQIVTNPDLTRIFQVNEELASRIRSAIRSVATVDELVDKVATKRYTKARIRRILTYILVGAVEKPLPEAIHVLGFTPKGQKHLKTVKKSVDIVARIGAKPWDAVTQQADQVYQLGNPQLQEQTWGKVPVRIDK
ncbi:Predicted nucleotidyltransferase [Streptococcus equinus]|uniref:nucleotidyltransferase n=1 Tax=Streptococcus equinus TaxID=1335 RepID=UPI0008716BBB|nr:nucleotidyltransferase [Streptococcus equinus]SCW36068.1 Predicted nucleotidyltransferase [Streptococcus equinus]